MLARQVATADELGIAVERGLVGLDLCLARGDVAEQPLLVLPLSQQREPRLRQVGLGTLERDLELVRVELE